MLEEMHALEEDKKNVKTNSVIHAELNIMLERWKKVQCTERKLDCIQEKRA